MIHWKIGKFWVLFLLMISVLTGCSSEQEAAREPKSSISDWMGLWFENLQFLEQKAQILHVVDLDGKPIPQAQVLIGQALDAPFASNFLMTDSQGAFVAPEAWLSEQIVTISAPGFVRTSFLGQVPQGQRFQIRPIESQNRFELQGQGLGFQTQDKDNFIDFALVMPLMDRRALFTFDLGLVMSPILEEIKVYGQSLFVPSNVALPRQKESYGLFTVTLEKPRYRLQFQAPGAKKVYAARGRFPFKQVAQELQSGKTFIQAINYFSILGGGLKQVTISKPLETLDMPVAELAFNQSKTFKAPHFSAEEFMLAIPVSSYQGEFLMTDVKNVSANTDVKLTTAAGEKPHLLVVIKKVAEQNILSGGSLTMAFVPFEDQVQPQLLPLISNPQIVNPSHLKVSLPSLPSTLIGTATYSALSTVEVKTVGGTKTEVLSRIWEVYSQQWQSEIKLPVWPNDKAVTGKKRWEITLVGSQEDKNIDLSPGLFETVTHATHGATDF